MFQLYKTRDFSGYLTDTVAFFKERWKNFFSNFIVITGALVLVLCAIFFFIMRDVYAMLLQGGGAGYDFSAYFQDNMAAFIALVGIAVVVTILFSIACMLYPITYMQLMEKTGRGTFTSGEILEQMKSQFGRAFRFSVMSLLIMMPLMTVVMIISVLAVFLVIGIFLIILLIPVFSVWYTQSFFVYMNEKVSYFEALGRAWNILFNRKFWHIVGSTFVVYMVINVIQGIFTMIPYFFMLFSMLSMGDAAAAQSAQMPLIMVSVYVISIVTSYLLMNLLMVTQGLIYYSSLEQKEHVQAYSEIDTIGQNAQ